MPGDGSVSIATVARTSPAPASMSAKPKSATVKTYAVSSGVVTIPCAAVGAVLSPASAMIVRVTGSGPVNPTALTTAAVISTSASGASTSLSIALSVTSPVLAVAPAGISSTLFSLSDTASTAAAGTEIVTVVAADDGRSRSAVTAAVPPVSAIEAGASDSTTTGAGSLSSTETTADRAVPSLYATGLALSSTSDAVTSLSASSVESSTVGRGKRPVDAPAIIEISKGAVNSDANTDPVEPIATRTRNSFETAPVRLTVNSAASPSVTSPSPAIVITGSATCTCAVASLVRCSALPASSVKSACTRIVWPSYAAATTYSSPVAPSMSISRPAGNTQIHWYA